MSEELDTTENPGKGKNIAGFVLSLLALLVGGWLMTMLYVSAGKGGAAIALLLPIAAIAISVMGMKASKAAGHKSSLGVAGMVIGIVALVYLLFAFMGLGMLETMMDNPAFQEAIETSGSDAKEALDALKDELNN